MEDWNLRTIIKKMGERFTDHKEKGSVKGFKKSIDENKALETFIQNNFKEFKAQASIGQGSVTTYPWIAIFYPPITTSAKRGIYVDYLYSSKVKKVSLCIQLGAEQLGSISQKNVENIKNNIKNILGKDIPSDDINLIDRDEQLQPTQTESEKALEYKDAVVCSINYDLENLPSNEEMMRDLDYFISLLKKITKEKLDEIFRNNSNIISEEDESYNVEITNPQIDLNTIYYGVPGTGKSYQVKQLIKTNNISDEDVFRSTLHPEYSYSDFVGQVLPDAIDNKPTYKYQPGIFTKALERALKVGEPVLLILEEMSRANVAAVFGDIFQLLDRDQAGKSDYGIDNDLIYNHLDEEAQNALKGKKIILPENLYIIGTVNTSDQNVFPMDNAFKRRFSWKYVSIETPDDENNPELTIKVGKGNQVTEYSVKWSELLFKLNEFIVSRDKGLGLTEDKQLGPYFIKFNDTNDIKTNDELIKNKLLQYLWDDVQNSMAAFGNANITLFDKSIYSFSELYECHDKQQIFSNEFLGKDYLDLLNQEADNHEE
ncbi:MrcB family domain-containing protein [Ligilactobacillus aviarius]|uniref:MrcB family domain-containing protein n=1 Tax=Ligilactobacillus aviarius TaxID=1606 RepID=UPI0024BBC9DA|nr:DUF3578 domain-containing protein [Ligilactobacillus aviarius]